jgi:hypothetical protein
MKAPFRFFRGELASGFYLKQLVLFLNKAVQGIVDEIVYTASCQFKLEGEVTAHEMPMREEDIRNIGKIAGVFLPRLRFMSPLGSIVFTKSYIVNGRQRSERGLMSMHDDRMRFLRTEQDEYPDDIVNEASEALRMTFVPRGTKPEGYVRFGTSLYDDAGNVIWENILPEPPEDAPYVPFYGEKFLVHQALFNREFPLPIEVYKPYFECFQRIRRNGPTIHELFEMTAIIGEGYIYDLNIVPFEWYYILYYKLDEDTNIIYRTARIAAWYNILAKKFKLFEPFLQREEYVNTE